MSLLSSGLMVRGEGASRRGDAAMEEDPFYYNADPSVDELERHEAYASAESIAHLRKIVRKAG